MRKRIWFKHANVSLNMPSFSNRLISCSALIMAGWLLERKRKALSPCGNKRETRPKMLKLSESEQDEIRDVEQKEEVKVRKSGRERNEVLKGTVPQMLTAVEQKVDECGSR